MTGFAIVLAKECRDNIRDRRTIISSLSLAVLGPALFVGLMAFVLDSAVGESSDPVEITVVGADHAPGLMAFLETQNTRIERVDLEDPRGAVAGGSRKLVLSIPDD